MARPSCRVASGSLFMQGGESGGFDMPTTLSGTFEVLGQRYDVGLNSDIMVEWCRGNGLNAYSIFGESLQIKEHPDGGYVAYFREFVQDEAGRRILNESESGFVKHPLREQRVSNVPGGLR